MKHSEHDTLSCLMDGEWQDLDVRRCVVEVCRDETLRARWARYHLARDAMCREPLTGAASATASDDLATRVAAALADEATYSNVTAIFETGPADGERAIDEPGAAPRSRRGPAPADGPGDEVTGETFRSGEVDDGTRVDTRVASARTSVPPVFRLPRGGAARTAIGGFGLAAGVALVTVVGLNAWQGDAPSGGVQLADEASAVGTAPVDALRVAEGAAGAGVPGTARPADDGAAGDAFSRQNPGAPLPEVEFVANTGAYWAAPGAASGASARREGSEARLNMFLSQHHRVARAEVGDEALALGEIERDPLIVVAGEPVVELR